MRALFLHEYVSGGGFADAPLPEELMQQGRAMRDALLTDLLRLGSRRVLTTRDVRLSPVAPLDAEWRRVRPGEHDEVFRECASRADEVWIIAPETGDRLGALTETAETVGARVLGSPTAAVRAVADKLALALRLRDVGLRVPRTWPAAEAEAAADEIDYPCVVKPVQGAGCEGVSLVRGPAELGPAVRAAERVGGRALIQTYIEGRAASVSVLSLNGRAVPLSLNGQKIAPGRPFVYHGGCVPLEHPRSEEALAAACRACEVFRELRGYVGVDLVLAPDGAYVIEVNPRLTASYLALREATDVNVAGLVLDALESGRMPSPPTLSRSVRFSARTAALRNETVSFR